MPVKKKNTSRPTKQRELQDRVDALNAATQRPEVRPDPIHEETEISHLRRENNKLRMDVAIARNASEDPWANRAEGMRCRRCVFFVEKVATRKIEEGRSWEEATKVGRCRRSSPDLKGYPVVMRTDWCGEFRLDENKGT